MTEEIFVYPDGNDDFLFRVSMAALTTSGPFSLFPGIDRTLILLEGKSLRLNDQIVPLLSPVSFPGEDKIVATLEIEGRDLNLMCRRGKVSGKILIFSDEAGFAEEADYCLVFALSDSVTVGTIHLKRYDSCLIASEEKRTVIKGERFLRIDLSFKA